MTRGIVEEQRPFDVAWRTIDGLRIRYATNGSGGEKVVLFSPWPESIFAFAPVWGGLTKQFEVLAIDLPGFGRSEARDDLFARFAQYQLAHRHDEARVLEQWNKFHRRHEMRIRRLPSYKRFEP